jgi:hypothetical protein
MVASPSRLRGLVVKLGDTLRFVPASVALQVAPTPRVTAVVGAPSELLGVALFSGVVLPVLAIGPARAQMVVCQCAGELVGVVGLSVVEAGAFDAAGDRPDGVTYAGEIAALLDVPALCASLQTALLARPRMV